jgi:HK97 family phage portal protein
MAFFSRLAAAYKAYTFQTGNPANIVTIFPTWSAWDAAINQFFLGNQIGSDRNYAALVGDPLQSSLVMAAIRALGNSVSEPDLEVRKLVDDQEDDEIVANHPLVQLWNAPNPSYSSSTLMKAVSTSWILADNAYIIKKRNSAGQVVQLWYEPHHTIWPVYPMDGSEFVTNYEIKRGADNLTLPVEDVIHFRNGLDPVRIRYGLSHMPSILREIYGDNETANYFANLMKQGAVPPYFLSLDNSSGTLSNEDLQNVKAFMLAQTQADNRGAPAVVTGKPEKLAWTPAEMDIRKQRYLAEERWCAVTGIPGVVMELGSAGEHSIYNNVEQAQSRFTENYLVPFWKHIEEELTRQLLPDFDQDETHYVTYNTSRVKALIEDETAKHARISADYMSGVLTRAEARRAMGYQADEQVDNVYFMPRNTELIPADYVTPEPVKLQPTVPNIVDQPGDAGMPPQQLAMAKKSIYPLRSQAEQDKMRQSWEQHAPKKYKRLINAK